MVPGCHKNSGCISDGKVLSGEYNVGHVTVQCILEVRVRYLKENKQPSLKNKKYTKKKIFFSLSVFT